jgi:fatty-acyl-CoA synthase
MRAPRARTFFELLAEQAAAAPDRPALVASGRSLTFAEWSDRSLDAAAELACLGVRRGSRIALLCTNRPEWLITAFGAARLGAEVAPLNTWAREWDLEHMLSNSRAQVLVTLDRFRGTDYLELVERLRAAGRCPHLAEVVVVGADAPSRVPDVPLPDAGASAADTALVLYTSGSAARPKAVRLAHGAAIENGFNIGERMGLRPNDRVWLAAPLFWAYGAVNALMTTLTHGATLVLQETFEPGEALALLEQRRCTVAYTLPTMTHALLEHPDFSRERLRTLRTGLTIGGPGDVRRAAGDLGIEGICNIYGATETYGNCCVTPTGLPLEVRMRCQGPPLPGVTIRVVDPETQRDVRPGEEGELLVRGYVSPGYVAADGTTEPAADGDGYYHTGDLGLVDEDGHVRFRARLTELIKRGGANVSPLEVEDFLQTHPAVGAAAVVGAPHPTLGEVAIAFVVPAEGATLAPRELEAYCRERLAGFKVPAEIRLRDELPKTDTGKLDRRALAALVDGQPK